MEKNQIIINEQQLRQIIHEELKSYLLEEGIFDYLKQKSSSIAKIFGTLAAGLIISHDTGADAIEKMKQEISQVSEQDALQEFDSMVSQKEQQLTSYGLKPEGAEQIVAGVLLGAKQQKEKELKYDTRISEEEKQQQIFDYQMQELGKLNDSKVVKDILVAKFQDQMEQQGRSLMVDSAVQQGRIGAPTPINSLAVGFGKEIQDNLVQYDQDVTTKKKNKDGTSVLGFKPTDLKSFWGDYLEDNAKIKQEIDKDIGTIYIRYSDYEYAAGEQMQKDISAQLQENKVKKLKNRLNELRGLYV